MGRPFRNTCLSLWGSIASLLHRRLLVLQRTLAAAVLPLGRILSVHNGSSGTACTGGRTVLALRYRLSAGRRPGRPHRIFSGCLSCFGTFTPQTLFIGTVDLLTQEICRIFGYRELLCIVEILIIFIRKTDLPSLGSGMYAEQRCRYKQDNHCQKRRGTDRLHQ